MEICAAARENSRYPIRQESLKPPKPFLLPSFNDEVVEVLPSEKHNQVIRFSEKTTVIEIENRYSMIIDEDDEDEDSYEIEIVEDDKDADFYLEIVDGEVFYVFETEDDISVDDEMDIGSIDSCSVELDGSCNMLEIPIDMMAPNLDEDETSMTADIGNASSNTFGDDSHIIEDQDDADMDLRTMMHHHGISDSISQQQRGDESSASNPLPPVMPQRLPTPPATPEVTMSKARSNNVTLQANAERTERKSILPPPAPRSPPDSPPPAPASAPSSPIKSILKACPPSPRKVMKKDNNKGLKKEKTFTKTYVRADDFDGEHRVYSWEKPNWTNAKLKSTGLGDEIRRGGNLANPITFPIKKPANAHLEEEEQETLDKEEIIRRITGNGTKGMPLLSLPGHRGLRKLKFSINGAKIRDGSDIVKPITKATVIRKPENINKIANQQILKHTPTGEEVRKGGSLENPVTIPAIKFDDTNHVANKNVLKNKGVAPVSGKRYEWEKPEWAKSIEPIPASAPKETLGGSSDHTSEDADGTIIRHGLRPVFLKQTSSGNVVRSGNDPSTKKRYTWEKPEWAQKRVVRKTNSGSSTEGEDMAALSSSAGKKIEWEKPEWTKAKLGRQNGALKPTDKGSAVRKGDNIALPITQLPGITRAKDEK